MTTDAFAAGTAIEAAIAAARIFLSYQYFPYYRRLSGSLT
jgi:hypothetical protein